jgi:hypothetical protein
VRIFLFSLILLFAVTVEAQVFSCSGTPFTGVSAANITDTTSTAVKAAAGAGRKYYITSISISNLHASVHTRVDVLDGATVVWQCGAGANGGGCTSTLPVPIVGTANTAINCQAGTTGAAVRCAVAGCIAP